MRLLASSAIVILLVSAARAQDQPPASAATPKESAGPVVLENQGKPMVIPFQCTAEDIQSSGMTCSEESPCAIYAEIAAATSIGDKYFAIGNIHSDSVTLYSLLLGSSDGGRTWRELYQRVRGAGLDHLQVLDDSTAWATGEVVSSIPQDPFVLITTDGKTWRQQAIFGESAENHFGSVVEFHFDSKTDGHVIIDHGQGGDSGRYALYESPNSGDTWTIKESSSKPLHLKPATPPAAEWRVRADGPTQAFVLERRAMERWVPLSSFAVKLGSCKPPQ